MVGSHGLLASGHSGSSDVSKHVISVTNLMWYVTSGASILDVMWHPSTYHSLQFMPKSTVWKFHKFSTTQILREIKSEDS